MQERIICAAIWYKNLKDAIHRPVNLESGVCVSGLNHAQCIHITNSLLGTKLFEQGEHIQGFLTSLNRFVDRKEGLKIAIEQNQIIFKHGSENILFSEDLLYD
jgi:hypothetical protein